MIGRSEPCDEGVIASSAFSGGCTDRSKPWVLAATILASSMAFVDVAAVGVALPVMQTELEAGIATMQWVVNAYSLLLAALMLIGGSAGDQFGRRRMFAIGMVVFAVASIICGLAAEVWQLIAARSVQGIGGALMIPNSLAIIGATFEEDERGKAIGTWAASSAIAGAIGPILGGWLVDAISWRAIFFLNVPLALVAAWITARHVPESSARRTDADLDWRGALFATSGLGAGALGLIEAGALGWRHPVALSALFAAVVLLFGFIRAEARSPAPMMPLELFRSQTFSGVNLLTLLLYAALGGVFFFVPFNLVQVQGYPASLAGAAFLPFTILMGLLSRWSGGLLDRFGAKRPLIFGPLVAALGFALFARPGIGGSYWFDFFPPMVILGVGMAITVAPLTATVMAAVPANRAGVASGVNNAVAEVATLFAVASFGAIGIAVFAHTLRGHVVGLSLGPEAARAVDTIARSLTGATLAADIRGSDRDALEAAIRASFLASFRLLMLLAAGLSLVGSLCASLMIDANAGKQRTERR